MAKSKKSSKPLTHEEIWDDSALVRSWDEAVEEYKLYHSIHARGENVEEVLRAAEEAAAAETHEESVVIPGDERREMGGPDLNDSIMADPEPTITMPNTAGIQAPEKGTKQTVLSHETDVQHPGARAAAAGFSSAATAPQAALNQVQDEGLKNLMMAWYYAGYYTGLYEGQQKANQKSGS